MQSSHATEEPLIRGQNCKTFVTVMYKSVTFWFLILDAKQIAACQTVRLFVQYWPFTTMDICLKAYKFTNVTSKFCQMLIKLSKIALCLKRFAKGVKFCLTVKPCLTNKWSTNWYSHIQPFLYNRPVVHSQINFLHCWLTETFPFCRKQKKHSWQRVENISGILS